MLTDLITSSFAELLGGLAVILFLALAERVRRQRRAIARRGVAPAPGSSDSLQARTYTLSGTLAPDGHPVRIVSTRPAGTVIYHHGRIGREEFELTDAMLTDGTYATEPLCRYQ
jgi:hypothetical protein